MTVHQVYVDQRRPDHGALALAFADFAPYRDGDQHRHVIDALSKDARSTRTLEIGTRARDAEILEHGRTTFIGNPFR